MEKRIAAFPMFTLFSCFLSLLLLFSGVAGAQKVLTPAPLPAEEKPVSQVQQATQEPPPAPTAPAASQPGVSFFFDDADIFEVVQTVFGEVLRVNYIIDPKVTGRVNFRTITPIPRNEILPVMEVIFRLNGAGFIVEEGLYRIIPLSDVSRELVFAQVGKDPGAVAMELFTFRNLKIKDSLTDIENALGLTVKGGKLRLLPIYRLNAVLVVASSKEQLDYVRGWVATFDTIFEGARPKVNVYHIQNTKAKDVANMLQQIFGASSSSSGRSSSRQTTTNTPSAQKADKDNPAKEQKAEPLTAVSLTQAGTPNLVSEITRIYADEVANTIIVLSTPEDYELIADTIRQIDILPRQVMIEALVAQIRLTDDMDFGLAWSLKTDINISGFRPFNNDINLDGNLGFNSSSLSELDPSSLPGFAFAGVDPSGIVRLHLEALASDSKLRVLASPHILVSDNREARIQIGDQVPIATSETNVSGTSDIIRTIQYKDTGIILEVKPQVNEGGLVSLDITQEVSTFSTQKIFDTDQVVISKAEAKTNLVAQDGQTIIIGGLIREDDTKSREGIPFLYKIPVLGHLFGNTTDNFARTELVILLTPRVIRSTADAKKISDEFMEKKHRSIDLQEEGAETRESGPEADVPDVPSVKN